MKSLEDKLYPFLYFYNRLPLSLRNLIGYVYRQLPFSLRYGNFYKKYLKRIKKFNLTNGEVQNLQNELLIEQLNKIIDTVPFYNNYSRINSLNELKKFPIVNKTIISENLDKFINNQKVDRALKSNTGGSSGNPFTFYIEKGVTRPKEAAHFDWYWGKYGYKPGDKVLMVRGKPLQDNADYEYQSISNKLAVSCYNLNQESIKEVYEQILKFNPKFVHAYPSSFLTFSKELQSYLGKEKPDFQVESIFLGSEYLFNDDQKFFETYYNSKVINWYGHSECLIHGGKCRISGDYHFYPIYGYLELIDESGDIIKEPGVEGKIIATGFDNTVMPLIRYDTGDIGIYSERNKCECGFKGKSLSKIVGREKEYIVLNDGTEVSLTAFIFGQHHDEFQKIREMQIVQEEPGKILVRVVPLDGFSKHDEDKFRERLINSVKGASLSVNVEKVEGLAKTHRGKHKLLIQNIEK